MIFWIGFTLMVLNEGFVMMRHVSPWFGRRRDDIIAKIGSNAWYRLHGTLDYAWIALVTIGLIVCPNRLNHIAALAVFWIGSFSVFYLPRWKRRRR